MTEKILSLARQKASLAWCGKETKKKIMDVELAEEFAKILQEYIDALQWCSGSQDFQPGGYARKGWMKIQKQLLEVS